MSLGANVRFSSSATTTAAPLRFQWQFATTDLAGQTNSTLSLTNVQLMHAGNYAVVVSDSSGSITSKVAVLEVDPTFTKITSSPAVKDTADGEGAAWVDFDNDGDLDLSVNTDATPVHLLYRNDGTNGFTQVRDGILSRDATGTETAAWADFDNDGLLDAFVSKASGYLFRQNPLGTFTRSMLGAPSVDWGVAAADFDNDGFVDLVVRSSDPRKSVWRNDGAGGFAVLTNSPVATSGTSAIPAADYDNDGDVDLFVSNNGSNSRLYRNDGNGLFTPITAGPLATQSANGTGAAWGDYDNDGFPDLFLGRLDSTRPLPSFLFRNHGDGAFSRVEQPPFTDPIGQVTGGSWGDYDNDGWLDLFISEFFGEKNRLFHNNGDGAFTRILSGSIANDNGSSTAGVWGDYDRDGFLDLFVANGTNGGGESNDYLYRNNGNKNGWLTIKLIGTVSNRSAIGAKVRLKATITGKTFWQLREINTGDGWVQNAMEAHFGLGDATNVEILRIEWPSGTVQTLTNVTARQLLTVHEPPRLLAGRTNGSAQISLRGGRGFRYRVDASADLASWSVLAQVTVTNVNSAAVITDTNAIVSHKFYRAVQAD